jgi:putative transposase
VAPLRPPAKSSPRGGRPRQGERRAVLQTLFSLDRSGCPWDLGPHALRPQSTAYASCAQGRADGTWAKGGTALQERTRVAAGRDPTPRAACMESHAVKTTEMGGPERGADGGKQSTGRKRPLWGATLGVLLAVLSTSAGLDAGAAASSLLGLVTSPDCPRLVTIFADQQYPNHAVDTWRAEPRAGWRIAVPRRPTGVQGFTPLAKRWVMERTNAWHGRFRRNSKDYERRVASSPAMIPSSNIHLMLNRLCPCARPAFHYRQDAA